MDLPDPKDIPAHIAAGLNKVIEERSGSVPEGGGQPPIPMTAAQILDEAEQGGGAVGGDHNGPIVLIMVGMAGTGKTTLTQRITAECMRRKAPPYVINLDPACNDPPYPVNIGQFSPYQRLYTCFADGTTDNGLIWLNFPPETIPKTLSKPSFLIS